MTDREANGVKKVMIGAGSVVLAAMFLNSFALFYWAGTLSQNVEHNTQTNERQDAELSDIKRYILPSHYPPDRRTP